MLFFNRKKKIYSPCSGQVKALSNVNDAVFSKGLAGDGFAVIPDDSVVSSPVDGTVTMIFPTKHAIGITDAEGHDYIVHIGIDTVNLKGNGFEVLVKERQQIKAGFPLVNVDYTVLKEHGLASDVIVLLGTGLKMNLTVSGNVKSGQEVGSCE